nr:uncharacterized protein CI109_004340 [Kwoniella shandongensis]KAA5527280.1 hypothetical protein CI109_004340 [Kwoniella shandongensis]
MPPTRRSSHSHSHPPLSPTLSLSRTHTHPRPIPPPNPPDPPLTLLHPTTSHLPPSPTLPTSHLRPDTHSDTVGQRGRGGWWKVRLFAGMKRDIRARIPWYISDWRDSWNYRVIPSTWFIFFANVLPGLAFSLDLIETTGQYGVQEVLLSSFMAAFVASFFGGQPLLISGVTGPITVFNKTIYDIFENRADAPDYLQFIGWVYLWAAIFHWIAAAMNAVKGLQYVTRFSCDTFGFYVAAVYVQYGIQVVTRQFGQTSTPSAFLGIILAILTLVLPHYFNAVAKSGYINKHFRRFCADYGMPITIIAMTGLAYWGRFDPYVLESGMTLPTTSHSFRPASDRPWLVRFWQLDGKWVGTALPFGLVLFILFYFDANVSSLIAQGSEYPLRKPGGFHWDFFLLGITTFIAGLLGIPAPNGLIPQAPLHTASLVVMGYEDTSSASSDTAVSPPPETAREENSHDLRLAEMEGGNGIGPTKVGNVRSERLSRRISNASGSLRRRVRSSSLIEKRDDRENEKREVPVAVVEQRVSNLAQGCLCLILMTKPFEHVLGLIPKGVLAGLFWYMGSDALLSSGVTAKILYLIRDRRATSPSEPLHQVRKSKIVLFTIIELLGFGATFAITQTIAAIGFPVIIMLLVPLRVLIVPRLGFSEAELDILDGAVASPFLDKKSTFKIPSSPTFPNSGFSESRRRRASPNAPTINMPPMSTPSITLTPHTQRLAIRAALALLGILTLRALFFSSSPPAEEIQSHGVLERVLMTDKYLDVSKYPFLQSRQGRDDRPDMFDMEVTEGILDFWTRYQKPFITGKDTAHLDTQVMRNVIDDLLQFNGWVASACPTLVRPFGQNSRDDHYEDLAAKDHLYYIAIVIHSADHFLVDQLAIIVQLARRLGTRNIFVSMLDQASTDSTPTLADLCEAVMTILGIAFRIRRVPPMTVDPAATYYPLEEAEARNLALEPLHELWDKRRIKFHRVLWLKGFTCPNDVLESLRVSEVNNAAMVCGMDWAEHNGFFIFSDRWRTRDIEGNLFRQAKSNSKPEAGPPRDRIGTERFTHHLPFQVYCCESGTHVVDPEQSYYRDISYRASPLSHNLSTTQEQPNWDPEMPCMDSTQMWFCRDLWTDAAKGGLKEGSRKGHQKLTSGHKRDLSDHLASRDHHHAKRDEIPLEERSGAEELDQRMGAEALDKRAPEDDEDSGTDVDAMNEDAANPAPEPLKKEELPASAFLIPNSAFTPARILVNPRCITTYGGVSHTQLAFDLFGGPHEDEGAHEGGNYVLEDWAGPPDSFVCQEMRTTGGRTAPKSQRRVGFLLQNEVGI